MATLDLRDEYHDEGTVELPAPCKNGHDRLNHAVRDHRGRWRCMTCRRNSDRERYEPAKNPKPPGPKPRLKPEDARRFELLREAFEERHGYKVQRSAIIYRDEEDRFWLTPRRTTAKGVRDYRDFRDYVVSQGREWRGL